MNRISENDTITATSYDKNGNSIAVIYDSGFTSISSVITALCIKGSGWLKKIERISILNEDKSWIGYYKTNGKKIY